MSSGSFNATENKSISKDVIDAVNLLAHGKRNILCGEIPQAVNQLQEACKILGSEYGELADECADAYLWYGKALLELSRMEGGVLGDAIPGDESEDSQSSDDDSSDEQNSVNEENDTEAAEDGVMSEDLEEEEEKLGANVDDKKVDGTKDTEDLTVKGRADKLDNDELAAAGAQHDQSATTATDDDKLKSEDINNETGNVKCKSSLTTLNTTDKIPEAEASSSNATASKSSEDNDDVSNLQLAWEILELAKLIYNRHEGMDLQLKLAETHLKLGEIGMETEQYEQAINDLTRCLQIQKQILIPEDRRLAETFYQLGLASTYCCHYDSAVEYYHNAMNVIESKIAHLTKVVAGEIPPDPQENGDGFYTPLELAQKEMEELREVLPDISAKIDDVKDEQAEAEKVKFMMPDSVPTSSGARCSQHLFDGSGDGACNTKLHPSVATSTTQPPVHNVSHLVRKKRKSDDEQNLQTELTKRQKTETEKKSIIMSQSFVDNKTAASDEKSQDQEKI